MFLLGFSGGVFLSLVMLVIATFIWFVLFKGVIYLAVLTFLTLTTVIEIDPYQFFPHYQARKSIEGHYLLFGTVTNLLASIAALFTISGIFQHLPGYGDIGIQFLIVLGVQYLVFENSRESKTESLEITY
jgi:hypothetical protein